MGEAVLLSPQDLFGTVGLVLLLAAFTLNTAGRMDPRSARYHALNFVGSGILAVYSVLIEAWVFLPLEVAWAAVALVALARIARGRAPIGGAA